MPETVAFIDVGTNSIHMLVVRFYEGSLGTAVYQDKESVRMGKSLYEKGYIDEETVRKAKTVISKFADIARNHGATQIVAMATCAAREAPNRADLVAAAHECGITLHVIPGQEEARLTRLGVVGPESDKPTLCIDVGGGSTELALVSGKQDLYLDSLSLGAIRMAFGTGIDQKGRVSQKDYEILKRAVDTQCYHSVNAIRGIGFEVAIGSSGTMEAIADACAARRGDGDGSYFTHAELRSMMKLLCSMTSAERARVPKISSNRADIVIGGGVIVDELMDLLKIDRMQVSRNGLREGMKTDYLLKLGHSDFDLRNSVVKVLAARCGCDTRHEEAVRRYSSLFCSEMVRLGLMKDDAEMRELLDHAAQLHDVGAFISYEKHNLLSYTIIRSSYLAGFDSDEVEKMALLARFHHNALPEPDSKYMSVLDRREVPEFLKYVMILRIADILDRGRDSAVEDIRAEVLNDTVNLTVSSDSDISMAMWKLKSVRDDFQRVFGRSLQVECLRI